MLLFLPILIGYATWQIVAAASAAGVGLIALTIAIRNLNNRRHMNNMIEAYLEAGEIGVEEYILAQSLGKSDRHAQLVFKLMMPTIQKHATEARHRRDTLQNARDINTHGTGVGGPPVPPPVATPSPSKSYEGL